MNENTIPGKHRAEDYPPDAEDYKGNARRILRTWEPDRVEASHACYQDEEEAGA